MSSPSSGPTVSPQHSSRSWDLRSPGSGQPTWLPLSSLHIGKIILIKCLKPAPPSPPALLPLTLLPCANKSVLHINKAPEMYSLKQHPGITQTRFFHARRVGGGWVTFHSVTLCQREGSLLQSPSPKHSDPMGSHRLAARLCWLPAALKFPLHPKEKREEKGFHHRSRVWTYKNFALTLPGSLIGSPFSEQDGPEPSHSPSAGVHHGGPSRSRQVPSGYPQKLQHLLPWYLLQHQGKERRCGRRRLAPMQSRC